MPDDLTQAESIKLTRLKNGWVAEDYLKSNTSFAFESTESLQRQLVRLIGKSGWKVEPERDDKGHFIKRYKVQ